MEKTNDILSGKFKYKLSGNVNDMLLFKIQKLEYLYDIQKGNIYMKNISFHRNIQKKYPDSLIGDAEEGLLLSGVNMKISDSVTGEIVVESCSCNISMFDKNPIFCAMNVDFTPDISDGIHNIDSIYFKPPKEIFDDFVHNSDDSYGIIIIDKERFIKRCNHVLDNMNLQFIWDRIKYTDKLPIERLNDCMVNAVFTKRKMYSYQNEYRLWINTNVDDHFILEIGDISDISIILSVKSGRNGIQINGDFREISE